MLKKMDTSDSHNSENPKRQPLFESLFKSKSAGTIAHKHDSKYNLLYGTCQSQERTHHTLACKHTGDQIIIEKDGINKHFGKQSHACGDGFDRNYHSITSVPNSKQSDLIIKYKNVCFQDSESNFSYSSDEHDTTDIIEHNNSFVTRPIFCPITKCAKVTTPESILQHFCFEHSKLPRIHLRVMKPHYLTLIPNKLTSDTSCLAVFLREACKRTNKRNTNSMTSISSLYKYEEIDPIFLMASKISISQKVNNPRNVNTDMEKIDEFRESKKIGKNSNPKDTFLFSEDEVLLLWISDINYHPRIYKITLSSMDKKHSHSYTGNPIHIKDKNDALSIYKRSECLIVHGTALNQLFNNDSFMQVILKAII